MIRRCSAPLTVLAAALAFGLGSRPMSAQADGMNSSASAGTADYTLTTTTAIPTPTGPPPGTANVTLSSTLTSGSPGVTVPSTSGLFVGDQVSGTGIPTGTTISQVNTGLSQVTLSQSATASGSESLSFSPVIAPPQVVALIQPAGGVVTPPSSSTQGPLTILSNSSGFNSSGVYDFLASKTANGQTVQALGLSFYGQGLAAGGIVNFSLNVANQSSPPQLLSQTDGVTIALTPAPATSSSSSNSNSGVTDAQVPEPLSLLIWSALAGALLFRARALRRSNLVAHGCSRLHSVALGG
ncbi:MAG: hypothetical protein ACHRXM_08155 [Isosphaerales bacterium]